jgi:hypothetical protein
MAPLSWPTLRSRLADPMPGLGPTRRLLTAGALLLVVLSAVAVGDRVVENRIRERLTTVLQCVSDSQGDSGATLDVRVEGAPAVVQLARGRLTDVTVTGMSAAALGTGDSADLLGGGTVDLELRGVGLKEPLNVESAQASAVLGWPRVREQFSATLGSNLPVDLGSDVTIGADGDQLALEKPDALLGQPLRVLFDVSAQPEGLGVTPSRVQLGGHRVGTGLLDRLLGGRLSRDGGAGPATTVPVPLPEGTTLTTARVGEAGLAVSLDVAPAHVARLIQATNCAAVR